MHLRNAMPLGCSWLLLLVATWLAFQPGLTAGFVFDDGPNLDGLKQLRDAQVGYEALQYALNGVSSELGRPLALFTFAAQHYSWPAHPEDFLRVNLLLHLLSGCLLFWAWIRLGRLLPQPSAWLTPTAACVAAALWMLAPLQVSTVLYSIQRMTILTGLFMLAGLLLYLIGRERLRIQARAGLVLMTLGVAVGTVLGVLSKENAALFPLMLLILEATLLPYESPSRAIRTWRVLVLGLPVLALLAYVALAIPKQLPTFSLRDFTLQERLLTESRILWSYLRTLFLPTPFTGLLYFDDYPISHGILAPWTTAVALAAWFALTGLALWYRRVAPVAAFGILWYLGCHLLESSVFPLELAFEHRNYIASAAPLLTAVLLLSRLPQLTRGLGPGSVRIMAAVALSYFTFATWQSSSLWGNRVARAAYWVHMHPNSRRAFHNYAEQLILQGKIAEANTVYLEAQRKWPRDASFVLAQLHLGCADRAMPTPSPEYVRQTAQNSDAPPLATLGGLLGFVEMVEAGQCKRYSAVDLQNLLSLFDMPSLRAAKGSNIAVMQARAAELAGDAALARRHLDEAILLNPTIGLIQDAEVRALKAGDVDAARRYVALAEHGANISWLTRWTYRLEIAGMRQLYSLYLTVSETSKQDASDHGAKTP